VKWETDNLGLGPFQKTGDGWNLHAYAHRKSYWTGKASWSVHRHSVKIAGGFADSLGQARKAAEQAMEAAK